ncbi:MAG: DNA polymerase III subunit gamma/tau [Pseudoflavonifractor sp.]|nr:DNA polymerase III subunit gamma/tau [Alloprevotella sp.]MCM1117613.1 DNA polymerase III subunit gamma/tau [Pseudoflavonifractor sp.]
MEDNSNYIVSARKYRPATFSTVVGQEALTATLKNSVATGRLAHSYLFCGPRGVGKTSCARIFAKTINCENRTPDGEACNECESCRQFNRGTSMNIIELDAASNNGVDDMRSLTEQVMMPPSSGRYRVFIVDEVHMLSSAAFNAFLKTLEEPPHYAIFILATTEKHKIIPTILSRCQIYDFRRITVADIASHLASVAQKEGISVEPQALNVIARKADGAMRDALSIFDQVAASSRGNITYQSAIENLNVLDSSYYSRLMDCFLDGRVLDSWMIFKEVTDHGFDPQFFINGLGAYLRDLMVAQNPKTIGLIDGDDEERRDRAAMASRCTPGFLCAAMSLCNDADLSYREASSKNFLIELTLAKICQLLSPSPADTGQGEGLLTSPELKPIAPETAQSQPQPQPQPQAAPAPKAAPAPRTASPTPSPTPKPAAPKGAGPRFSIRHAEPEPKGAATADAEAAAAGSQGRRNPFTHEQLLSAWEAFAASRPAEHILVNTMRASLPVAADAARPEALTVTVENEVQTSYLTGVMGELMAWLHERLANDFVTLSVEINRGESAFQTWNDRELIARMKEENPRLASFINDFKMIVD